MLAFASWGSIALLFVVSFQIAVAQDEFSYFDLGLDNPLTNIWNGNGNRNTIVPDTRRTCTVGGTGGNREGSCLNAAACRFQRGKAEGRGTCSFWNTCCVFEKVANQTTDARVTYFVSTRGARQLPQAQKMYVRMANKNVCQMRVDILDLNLLPPANVKDATTAPCNRDYLRVEPNSVSNPIPDICGPNKNTHFYVHLDSNQVINNGIILSVNLLSTDTTLEPSWTIQVTQLECPGNRNLLNLQNHKENRNQAVSDFSKLAPARCLQYFTEPSGQFFNFGFTSPTVSVMATKQDYAVCFKPVDGNCGVSLTPTFLNLRSAAVTACAEEAIIIPEATITTGVASASDRKCLPAEIPAAPAAFISKHTGPLYVHFKSEEPVNKIDDTMPYGFHFNYVTNNVPCP